MATLSYHEQKDIENIKKLRELQKELPSFCSDFFRGIETSTSTRTRIAYAYDLKIFFQFLKTANPGTFDNPSHTLTPSDLEKLTVTDLEEYIDYLKCHPSDTNEDVINTERGLMRKVSSTAISSEMSGSRRTPPPSCACRSSTKRKLSVWRSMRWQSSSMKLRKVID